VSQADCYILSAMTSPCSWSMGMGGCPCPDPPLEMRSLSQELHWLNIPERMELLIAVMVHGGCLNWLAPVPLSATQKQSSCHLWPSLSNHLAVLIWRCSLVCCVCSAHSDNNLTDYVRHSALSIDVLNAIIKLYCLLSINSNTAVP